MNIALRVLFLTLLIFGAGDMLCAQTTWTGSVSTAWNTAGNWTAGIPDANDDVTIPNVTNDPVISAAGAVAKSVTVQTGGLLTIDATGTITIDGSTAQGFLNKGTVQNNGTITIGANANVGQYGIYNEGTFSNTGGHINIDRSSFAALYIESGTFTNTGAITIGANIASGNHGIYNKGIFNNNTGGQITIDRVASMGIYHNNGISFTNQGTITVGALSGGNTFNYGIYANPDFNNAGGHINIDRATFAIAANTGSFNNTGSITVGAATNVPALFTSIANGTFNNNTGGVLKGTGSIDATQFVNAGGSLAPGASIGKITFDTGETFSNNTLAIEVNGTGVAGNNYDQVVVNGTATLGGTLALAINYTATVGDQITVLSAYAVSGSFTSVTGLPANWYVNYTTTGVILTYGFAFSTSWTGAVSTDWNTAGNWTGGVPTATMDVTIDDVTNDPLLNTATGLAKTILVQPGGSLTIGAAGTLAINNSAAEGILNRGSVQNNGTITIGATAASGQYGIYNTGSFNNNTGGKIFIDRATLTGLRNLAGSTFTNAGAITIGATATVGEYGINNEAVFNSTAGQINIDRATTAALYNSYGTFTNAAGITIGANAASGQYGIQNLAAFNNNTGSQIRIDQVSNVALFNYFTSSTFTNAGAIIIGATTAVGNYGIRNVGPFTNTGGQINIDRAAFSALYNVNGPFTNTGTITIGANAATGNDGINNSGVFNNNTAGQINIDRVNMAVTVSTTLNNTGTFTIGAASTVGTLLNSLSGGTFNNNTGGIFKGAGSIAAAYFINAGGTLAPGASIGVMTLNASKDLNNTYLNIEVNGTGVAGTNFDQLVVNGTATLGGTLAVTINYTPTAGDQITIVNATAISGTFATVTGLPANWYVSYTSTGVVLSYGFQYSTTWTGAVSTDWNTTGNWTAGVPTAAMEVFIPDVTNDPLLNTATGLAKTITVESGASLTIGAAGTLTINNSAVQGILNKGVIENNGTITIGATAAAGQYGIHNSATFNNNAGAAIIIDRVTTAALLSNVVSTFTNAGTITIGATATTGQYGIYNAGIFSNTGGQININRATVTSILNTAGTFTNAGAITMGANAATGQYGINNTATFNNNTGGQINIDRVTSMGINHNGTGFTNQGTITIGSLSGGTTFNYGIYTEKNFNNAAGGQINIDRVNSAILTSANTFDNSGTITIGANTNVFFLLSNLNNGTFSNSTGGVFKGSGNVSAARLVNAGGTLAPGASIGIMTIDSNEGLSNSILNIEVNGTGLAGTNFDQLVVNGTATLGGTLVVAINYAPAVGDQIKILSATAVSGTFATVTGLAANWYINYTSTGVILSYGNPLLTTWTGAVSTDWNTAGNWTNGVPAATVEAVIPDVTNDPLLNTSTGLAKTITVQSGASLTIGATGTLTINNSTAQGILNQGTIQNNGTISIGATAASGQNGINNTASFNNNAGGHINIDRITTTAVYTSGTFTNAGAITIGANAATGADGIDNYGVFNNNTGAQINIDRVTNAAIYNPVNGFVNQGAITIGSLSAGNTILHGIYIENNFSNTGGQINIDRVNTAITVSSNTFDNAGAITIGANTSVATLLNSTGTGTFNNSTGGVLKGTGSIAAARYVNAGGNLMPGAAIGTMTFNAGETFSNNTLNIEVNGASVAGTDFDRLTVLGTATLGGTLAVSINYTPSVGDIISILNANAISGTFSTVTGLPANWNVNYSPTEVTLSYGILSGTTTWTGAINTDWNTAGNWTAGIPNATQEVIIPDVTNDPVISTATGLAKTITVQSGGSLTIDAAGTLAINYGAVQGILNQGTVENNGTITIGAIAASGQYGINNNAVFNNNAGATIILDRVTTAGILNGSTFTNTGAITIGATAAVGQNGINNAGTFSNTGGQINIDRVSFAALFNSVSKTFTNTGGITIGANATSGQFGIDNRGTFNNNTGSHIRIDRTTSAALHNFSAVNFTNFAVITIGANAATGTNGIENYGVLRNLAGAQINIDQVTNAGIFNGNGFNVFTNQGTITIGAYSAGNTINNGIFNEYTFNNAGGQINIDRVTNAITVNANTLSNTGIVTIGKLVPVTTLLAATGSGSFSNNTGGEVKGTGTINAARFVNNSGQLSPGYSPGTLTFTGNETFTNSTMNIELAGTAVAGTNYDQIVVNGTATLGGNLTVTAINGFTILAGQSFVILTGTSVTGTFASVTLPIGVTGTVTYSSTSATLNILTALPLTLVEFTGEAKGGKTLLKWKTADEENTFVFEVERSTDGASFTKTGTVTAMGSGAHSYSFTDENPMAGNNYYRLKMVDKDGRFTYSKTETVKFAVKGGIQITPVPANSYVTLTVQDQSLTGERAQVYNTAGILVTNVILTNSTRIDISSWPNGMYNIKTSIGTYRFIKQ
jgi:hypothetical protein